jgi:hypothetical protein
MSLNMYLDKKLYVSEFNKEEPKLVDDILKIIGVEYSSNNFKHVEVVIPAIYWKKSNHIYKWFVDNVQGGNDDCGDYQVNVDDLRKLLGVVKAQLKNKKKIILEPQSSFFFGSTEVDEFYWGDLERTKTELEREIKFYEDEWKNRNRIWDFYYRTSW